MAIDIDQKVTTDIEQQIIKIAAENLKIDESKITSQSSFVDDLRADSLDQVELMMAIEAKFDCHIPDDEARKIATIADAVNYVKLKTSS
jgi:acyl carrier protein